MRYLMLVCALVGCAGQQYPCGASSPELQRRHADELDGVSQSGVCDDYAVLDECPDAVIVNDRAASRWDAWEKCE